MCWILVVLVLMGLAGWGGSTPSGSTVDPPLHCVDRFSGDVLRECL